MSELTPFRFFVSGDEPGTVEAGVGGLFRLGTGEPLALAEVLRPNGEWVLSDRIARAHLLGSDDTFTETTAERARQIILAWLSRGRISVRPKTLPGDPGDGLRTPTEQAELDTVRERARATQAAIERSWAAVPPPARSASG